MNELILQGQAVPTHSCRSASDTKEYDTVVIKSSRYDAGHVRY